MMIRPSNMDTIDEKALEVGGVTKEELESLDYTITDAVEDLKSIWGKYIDKYDKEDKFVVAGYFVRFDVDFLREMFFKSGDRYGIGSWCFTCLLDVPSFISVGVAKYGMRFKNFKLETVCEKLGVPLKAHNALSDIKATRILYEALGGLR
jgi:DNA polymerase-3 subunit epsilon